uniref:Uncharacterized protein n=1 Tax=Nelumbo nucifera TaxID=4432 RepID=A0A822YYG3_NELNU|nr:TPA_asm: hypothetical protein HUJ06_007894 [Nelumbo nucifera]
MRHGDRQILYLIPFTKPKRTTFCFPSFFSPKTLFIFCNRWIRSIFAVFDSFFLFSFYLFLVNLKFAERHEEFYPSILYTE